MNAKASAMARQNDAPDPRPDGALPRVDWRPISKRKVGDWYGYTHISAEVAKAVQADGRSDVALHLTTPWRFRPVRGKANLLYALWEGHEVSEEAIPFLRQADALIVASAVIKQAFDKVSDCQVYELPFRVDLERYPYRERTWDGESPFRWLWFASPDPRRGWPRIAKMWEQAFGNNPDVELWIHTPGENEGDCAREGNVVVDTRRMTDELRLELYYASHGFLYVLATESFGWTLAESVATGLPSVAAPWSESLEWCNYFEGGSPTDLEGTVNIMKTIMKSYLPAQQRARKARQALEDKMLHTNFNARLHNIIGRYR